MTQIIVTLFYSLPPAWRKAVRPWIRPLAERVKMLTIAIQDLRVPVYTIERAGMRVAFIGHDSLIPYFSTIFFGDVIHVEPCKRIFSWQIRAEAAAEAETSNMVVVNLGKGLLRRLLGGRILEIPPFIIQVMDLPASEAEIADTVGGSTTRDDRRKIKKYQYTYSITRDPEKYRYFYEEFYSPYIANRHGERSYVPPLRDFMRVAEEGELLLVAEEDQPVSGVIFDWTAEEFHNHSSGLRHNDPELMQRGAAAAHYYFSIVEAVRRGCKRLNFGRSRPFLLDGVVQFKKKWKTVIKENRDVERQIGLMAGQASGRVFQVLKDNPFIVRRDDEFHGAYFLRERQAGDPNELKTSLKQIAITGLAGLTVVNLDADDDLARASLREIAPDVPAPIAFVPRGAEQCEGFAARMIARGEAIP